MGIKDIVGGHSVPPSPPPHSKALRKVKGNRFKGRNALTKQPIITAYYVYALRHQKKEKKSSQCFLKSKAFPIMGVIFQLCYDFL